jgi:hypothetical protein
MEERPDILEERTPEVERDSWEAIESIAADELSALIGELQVEAEKDATPGWSSIRAPVPTRFQTPVKAEKTDLLQGEKLRATGHSANWTTRTYKLPKELVAHLDGLSRQHNVGKSDLVAYLLTEAVRQAERGDLTVKTRPPAGARQIDYGE